MTQKQHDVLIIGAGVIGLACALYLLRAGRSVIVVDQGRVGGGASHGNCGTITPSHAPPLAMPGLPLKALRWMLQADAPFYIKPRCDMTLLAWLWRFTRHCNWDDFHRIGKIKAQLLKHARTELEELIRTENPQCEFQCSGTLSVFRDQNNFDATSWLPQSLQRYGLDIERLTATEARAREHALNDSIVGGYFIPGDAHLRPEQYVSELARAVRAAEGEILEASSVQEFVLGRYGVESVVTVQGNLKAREVVLATGAWSPQLAQQLDLFLPIQPGKGYSLTYDQPLLRLNVPLVLKERSVCVTSWANGFRLGSTMEFSGYDATLNRQ